MERDSRGRFKVTIPEDVQRMIDEDNRRAAKIIKVAEALDLSPEMMGVKNLGRGYWIEGHAMPRISGLGLGLVLGGKLGREKLIDLLTLVQDALA